MTLVIVDTSKGNDFRRTRSQHVMEVVDCPEVDRTGSNGLREQCLVVPQGLGGCCFISDGGRTIRQTF